MTPTRHSSNKENAIGKTLLLGKGSSAPADPKMKRRVRSPPSSSALTDLVVKRRVRSQLAHAVPAQLATIPEGSTLRSFVDGQVDHVGASSPMNKITSTKPHLPQDLKRPPFRAANSNALISGMTAVDPIFSDIPAAYVQEKIRYFGEK